MKTMNFGPLLDAHITARKLQQNACIPDISLKRSTRY